MYSEKEQEFDILYKDYRKFYCNLKLLYVKNIDSETTSLDVFNAIFDLYIQTAFIRFLTINEDAIFQRVIALFKHLFDFRYEVDLVFPHVKNSLSSGENQKTLIKEFVEITSIVWDNHLLFVQSGVENWGNKEIAGVLGELENLLLEMQKYIDLDLAESKSAFKEEILSYFNLRSFEKSKYEIMSISRRYQESSSRVIGSGRLRALLELEQLVGLKSVKEEVISFFNLAKINRLREEKGFQESKINYHMVFTGNPGTGKTTVARIISELLHSSGFLSKGHLIEVDRSQLVSGFVGQTALLVRKKFEEAKGGVLFIDEAYSLSRFSGSNDFGQEAVDTIVKLMEDYRKDLVVIVAGYPNEMFGFIQSNPGLRSRFNKFINFPDYSSDEMIEIFKILCDNSKLTIESSAEQKLRDVIENLEAKKDFGNARTVRNLFEKTIQKQANRLIRDRLTDARSLQSLVQEDIVDVESS